MVFERLLNQNQCIKTLRTKNMCEHGDDLSILTDKKSTVWEKSCVGQVIMLQNGQYSIRRLSFGALSIRSDDWIKRNNQFLILVGANKAFLI